MRSSSWTFRPLVDPSLVASTIAGALGVATSQARQVDADLIEALEHRTLLLVLDVFEHLMPAAPLVPRSRSVKGRPAAAPRASAGASVTVPAGRPTLSAAGRP